MTVFRALIMVFSLSAVACGSGDSASPNEAAGGAPGMPECPPSMGPIDPAAMIDDFEDGNSALLPVSGRQSEWWITGDGSVDAMVSPSEGPATPERILGGRCGSLYGMHVSGQGFTDWGAVLSVSMRYEDGPGEVAVDFSDYRGIRFWAKVGDLHTAPLRVALHDQNAHPNGGICDVNSMEIGVQCWDSFGAELRPLSKTWQEYVIYFDRLTQREFGVKEPALDPTQIYQLDFLASQNTIFDFWLDDVWLVE